MNKHNSKYKVKHLKRIYEIERKFKMSIENIFITYGEDMHFNEVIKLIGYRSYRLDEFSHYCKKRYNLSEPVFSNLTYQEEQEAFDELFITRESAQRYLKYGYELKRVNNKWKLIKPPIYPTKYYLAILEDKHKGRNNLIKRLKDYLTKPRELYEVSHLLKIPHHDATRDLLTFLGFEEELAKMKKTYRQRRKYVERPNKLINTGSKKTIKQVNRKGGNKDVIATTGGRSEYESNKQIIMVLNPKESILAIERIREISNEVCFNLLAMFCLNRLSVNN